MHLDSRAGEREGGGQARVGQMQLGCIQRAAAAVAAASEQTATNRLPTFSARERRLAETRVRTNPPPYALAPPPPMWRGVPSREAARPYPWSQSKLLQRDDPYIQPLYCLSLSLSPNDSIQIFFFFLNCIGIQKKWGEGGNAVCTHSTVISACKKKTRGGSRKNETKMRFVDTLFFRTSRKKYKKKKISQWVHKSGGGGGPRQGCWKKFALILVIGLCLFRLAREKNVISYASNGLPLVKIVRCNFFRHTLQGGGENNYYS